MELTCVAVYRRRVGASLERALENVHDWEHLPWLHHESFTSIELLEQGDWGWRARTGLPAGQELGQELEIELRFDQANRYVSRTVAGPGAGTEIWTTLDPVGPAATGVEVRFLVPGIPPERAEAVGARFVALYTRLWDQDEEMMIERTARLAAREPAPTGAASLELGPVEALRQRLPLLVELGGRRWRIVDLGGEIAVHAATCPHRLGPLDAAGIEEGSVICPWHGYRFDVRSGLRCDAAGPLRLPPPPSLVIDAPSGRARLEASAPRGTQRLS